MSLLNALTVLEPAKLSLLHPFIVSGSEVGWVSKERAETLRALHDEIRPAEAGGIALRPRDGDINAGFDRLLDRMVDAGLVELYERESSPVTAYFGGPVLAEADLTIASWLGLLARGVHLNGWFKQDGEIYTWLGRRAAHHAHNPGKLDNMAAGGWAQDDSADEAVRAEAVEEACIPDHLLPEIRQAGLVSYELIDEGDVRREAIMTFDLELPADFTPVNGDGMVDAFTLHRLDDLLDEMRSGGGDLKYNTRHVLIDFALRHGAIDPDTEPDYVALRRAVQAPRCHRIV